MKYYLLTFSRDWADEFYCNGLGLVNETEYNQLVAILTSDLGDKDMNFGFGTNEGWEGEFTFRECWEDLGKQEVTEAQAKFLIEYVLDSDRSFGIFPSFGWLFEYLIDDFFGNEDEDVLETPLLKAYFDASKAGEYNIIFE